MTTYQKFINWAKDNGAIFDDLSLHKYDNGERGIHSKKGTRKGKTIIKIPLKLIIHDGMGENTFYGNKVKKYADSFQNYKIIMVILYILSTNNKVSFFKPYYDILPKNILNFPIFWNDTDKEMLKGSNIHSEIIIRQRNILNDYNKICKIVPTFKNEVSIKQFLWVRTIVGSRNFGIEINNKHRVAMVPLCDLLNHDNNPDVNWFFDYKDKYFKMKSNRYIKQNIPITDTYGSKSNLKYFLFYGFTIANNDNDLIFINIEHGSNNKKLKDMLIPSINGYLGKDNNNMFFNKLISFLRISVSSKETLKKNNRLSYYSQPFDINNELLTLKAFKVYLNTLINKYTYFFSKNHPERRDNIIKFSKRWNAYNLVMGEISVINIYLELIKNGENILNKKEKRHFNNSYLEQLINYVN